MIHLPNTAKMGLRASNISRPMRSFAAIFLLTLMSCLVPAFGPRAGRIRAAAARGAATGKDVVGQLERFRKRA